jgi:DNA polymerase III subunit epsilon
MSRLPARPPRSSRRASWREAAFIALDFETTGLDPARDDVISFGLVPIDDGRIDLSAARYREVAPRIEPRHSSIRVHHLRTQDLASAPPMSEVVDGFRDSLAGRVILAWAAGVEVAFLRRIFGGREWRWRSRVIDVRTLIVAIERSSGAPDTGPGSYALEAAVRRYGVPVEQTHHALDDAFMTAELFLVAATRLSAGGRGSVHELRRITLS